jgi:hypothetical protein
VVARFAVETAGLSLEQIEDLEVGSGAEGPEPTVVEQRAASAMRRL